MPRRSSTGRIQLKPTQERALARLREEGSAQLTRGQYEEIAGVSRSQAAYDLAELVEAGVLERVGGGRSTRYRLARGEDRPGRRRWTNERIRSALEEFCAGRTAWPSATAFRDAGRSDLYVAASRYGGIAFWSAQLGFARPEKVARRPAVRRHWLPRLRWAGAAAVGAAALVAIGGATLQKQASAPSEQHAAAAAASAEVTVQSPRRGPDARRARTPARKVERPRVTRRAPTATRQRRTEESTASPTSGELVVQRTTPRTTMNVTATPSSGPTPLAAPGGGGSSTPNPLPSP